MNRLKKYIILFNFKHIGTIFFQKMYGELEKAEYVPFKSFDLIF